MKTKIKKIINDIKTFFTLKFKHGEKLNLEYPISWESMSYDDFKSVCIILSKPHGKKESLFLFLCALAHIRPDNPIKYDPKILGDNMVFIIGQKSYVITPTVIQEACSQLEFIYNDVGLSPCPLPKVDRKLYGLTFEQYYEADAYILRYNLENNEAWLKAAAKVLTKGAVRKLQDWQKKGLVIWWNGIKTSLMTKYPYIFQEGGAGGTERTPADILQELLSLLNKQEPQNNEKIIKSDLHTVLFTLNKIYENNAHK